MEKIKLTKEELKEYLEAWLSSRLKSEIYCIIDSNIDECDIKNHLVDEIYDGMIMAIGHESSLLFAKRSEKFNREKMAIWISGKDYMGMYHKKKDKMNLSNQNLFRSSVSNDDKEILKRSIEESVITNPDIDRKTIVETICDKFLKKSKEKEDAIDRMEDELKKTTSNLYCKVSDSDKKLYKSIYREVETKLENFPSAYVDAFAILEYIKKGGRFLDPIMSVPVEYNLEKDFIVHSSGDGDVHI